MNKAIVLGILSIILLLACSQEPYVQGKRIYDTYCLNCHMKDGSGLGALYPDLSKSAYLNGLESNLACLIYNGSQSTQLATVAMPAHRHIEPASMTNLINFLSYRWGNKSVSTLREINAQLAQCPQR